MVELREKNVQMHNKNGVEEHVSLLPLLQAEKKSSTSLLMSAGKKGSSSRKSVTIKEPTPTSSSPVGAKERKGSNGATKADSPRDSLGITSRPSAPRKTKFSRYMPELSARSLAIAQNVDLSQANVSKVERSWYLIFNKLDEVALRCFLRMFNEHPDLVQLFPFSSDCKYDEFGKLILDGHSKAHVNAHASAVLQVVGTCVAGLTRIHDLIPKLRHIGKTHRRVGLQEMHYALLYRYLIETIREEVGPDNWDQETEDAWEQAFASITDLLKRPSTRLETEPLEGYGLAIAIASLYYSIATPFRLAGFLYGKPLLEAFFDILDVSAAFLFAMDLIIHLVTAFKPNTSLNSGSWLRRKMNRYLLRARLTITNRLQLHRMERWVPWPKNDVYILLSFPLQYLYSFRPGIGLHWTHIIGLFRICTASRILHFLSCAENKALFDQKLSEDKQVQIRISKLMVKLCFVIHLSGCCWCIVARYEAGAGAKVMEPTAFFADTDILFGTTTSVINSYTRAMHWAFVNLTGIGNVESTPTTTLECLATIITHLVGAIFYAIVTGNVISMIEEASVQDGKIGMDIAKLTSLMDSAKVSTSSKERIIKGYMLRNVLTSTMSPFEHNSTSSIEGLNLNDEVLETLPTYLRHEVSFYVRAELIRRRDRFFHHCSNRFLVAVSNNLSGTRTLLTGDYLMKEGEKYENFGFVFVESGSLQVRHNQNTIRTLEQGSVVGKGWLLFKSQRSELLGGEEDSNTSTTFNEFTDWCNGDGTAGLSIRALSPCTLLTGLTTVSEIEALEKDHKGDFALLRAEAKSEVRNKRNGAAAAREECPNVGNGEMQRVSVGIRGAMKVAKRLKRSTVMGQQKRLQSKMLKEVLECQEDGSTTNKDHAGREEEIKTFTLQ